MSTYIRSRNAAWGLGCSTSLYSQAVFHPQAVGALFIGLLQSTGLLVGAVNVLGFTGLGTLALGVGYAAVTAAAIGLQLALQKKPAAPQPSDVQTNIRQEISPRRRIYGRYLTGSVIVFGFRRGEKSYLLHYVCEGPISGYVSFRLDKKPVTLDGDGFVTQEQYQVGGRSRVQILTTLGTMNDEPFAELLAAFPELDTPLTPFRHRGCAMALQIVEQVSQDKLQDVYPNNMPSLQFVIDALEDVYDPRTDSWGFSDNAGCCLLTEIMDVYGLTSASTEDIDFNSFAAFAEHCDENVALRSGGVEKRYRCAGPIFLDAENEDRIKAIASVCNGDVFMDRQGRIAVRQKLRATPGIALRAMNGDHLSIQLEGGRPLQKRFNTVKVGYVDPALNWKANEVRWRHPDFYVEDGSELLSSFTVNLCPSATQAQRLAKLAVYENNPDYVGSLTSGPQALDLMEDYVFTLDLSPEETFERVAAATDVIEYDAEQMSVSSPFMIFGANATDWNPAEDEQDQVIVPPDLPANVDDVTLVVLVTVEIQENSAPVLKFSWTAAGGATLPDSYAQQVEVSAADADEWNPATVNQDQNTAIFAAVADGGSYDWRIRNVASGKTFDWQNSTAPVTVVVDDTPPAALLSFSAGDGTGQFTANFGTTNDAHLATVAIYKTAPGATLNRATNLIGRYAVAPGISYALPIASGSGAFDIYAEPFNRSDIAGPLAGPDQATVS
ncbi:putative tail protein [Mesorhizobium sp. J18]|uniref:phage tail protein n=1 Tax=Mesorhizobium sp. J18 TaxID=935263 RepID=UPI00119B7CEB|nr:phage tail protein [Mesorhizobium sp. J18]TWG90311.1 putative tail protein [Mesorhizobium sp. J18]